MIKQTFLAISTLALLSGCALLEGPKYACPLEGVEKAKCASMEEAYAASRNLDPNKKTNSVFSSEKSESKKENRAFFQGKESSYPEPSTRGEPVFQQPNVYRVWVAPYVDAEGNLRSGEYVYISTPGKWNYGSLKKSGSGSGIFSPVRPNELGFNPSSNRAPMAGVLAGNQSSPPTPSSSNSTAPNVNEPGLDNGSRPSSSSNESSNNPQGGITQPYVRLNNR